MKKFFLLIFLAISASTAMAQSQKLFENNSYNFRFRATLPEFSYNGKAQIYLMSEKYENDRSKKIFTFYSDEFEKQNEITVSGVEYDWSLKREEREWKDDGYKGDWKVTENESGKSYTKIFPMHFDDFDQSCDGFRTIYMTQTLFNTDEKYEFLMPLYSSDTYTEEEDHDGDGNVDHKTTSTGTKVTGFQIVSEDGTVIETINFDGGFRYRYNGSDGVDLLKVNGKLYLSVEGETDKSLAVLIYSIDPAKSTVRMMSMEKVSSVPTRSYNLSGRPTKGEKGINIVRMSDGTTKKVLVR